jgi:hypothetical protein
MHVESVSVVLHVPPLIAFVLTLYVLVLIPVPGAIALILSQVAAQSFHSPQSPTQSTGQTVLVQVESVSVVLFAIGQVRPLLIATVLTIYVLDLVPILDVALTPSQIASQAVQVSQFPTQLT